MSIKRITEDEVRALWVQRLSDTPNRPGRFGTGGMSAAEVKAVYDALPLRLVECCNALVDGILDGTIAAHLPAVGALSLSDILAAIPTGELAALLSVDGTRTLAALAAALDTHDHKGLYAELSESGHLRADQLPEGSEGIFAEAEAARAAAEKERQAAEAERGKALRTVLADMAALEAREEERERREAAREETLAAQGEALAALSDESACLSRRSENITRRLACLEEAGLGTTHTFIEDKHVAARKEVPEGALPCAALTLLGGGATAGERARTVAIVSHGGNLLPHPYPAAPAGSYTRHGVTFRNMGDGSIILNGTATENIYYVLYNEHDGLSLPTEGVYIHSMMKDGVTLYVKTGTTGSAWKVWAFRPAETDPFFDNYYVYLLINAGASFTDYHIHPAITLGMQEREAVPYRAPYRVEIPAEVRDLPAYGLHDNLLDLEAGVYRQRRTESGAAMADEVTYPLPAPLTEPLWLPVDAGGYVEIVTEEGTPAESHLTYTLKV